MKIFRLGLFSLTWSNLTDPKKRSEKAKELRENRRRINIQHIEPYSDENVLKDSKAAFEGSIKGEVKTIKDVGERAKFKKKEALEIRNNKTSKKVLGKKGGD